MSKRHQSSRRRAYGRRQHEIHERESRRLYKAPAELDLDTFGASAQPDPLAFFDPRTPRLRFGLGD